MSGPLAADETSAAQEPDAAPPSRDQHPNERLGSQLAGILSSLRRLADLQLGIWLTHTKMAVVRIVLCAVLWLLALLLAIVGIIFLYAGLYHVLTEVLLIPTAWALLIFAGVHLLLAGILTVAAIALLRSRNPRAGKQGGPS